MRVEAKKLFISTRFGNVERGRILDIQDGHAKQLIDAGLVKEIKESKLSVSTNVNTVKESNSDLSQPTKEETLGSSSQVDQASKKKTVKKSVTGKKVVRTAKSQS